jgi:hypothetical protein
MIKRFFPFLPVLFLVLFASCNPITKLIDSDDVLHWEQDMQVFDSLNAAEDSDEKTLLVTGSSSIRLWDQIHEDLAPFEVMQRGYGGAKLTDFNYYTDRIIKPQQFKAILIFVANDIAGGDQDKSPKEVFQLYKALVKQIRERNPNTPIFWIEVTPTPSRWNAIGEIREAGDLIKNYCKKSEDLFFIDTYDQFMTSGGEPDPNLFRSDMLHLNPGGYELWTEIILGALEEKGIKP